MPVLLEDFVGISGISGAFIRQSSINDRDRIS